MPDIPVKTTLEEDKAYLSDPYKPQPAAETADNGSQTNAAEPRFNEAELVREHREGINPGEDLISSSNAGPTAPAMADPALARALDVLKGLAVVNGGKPG